MAYQTVLVAMSKHQGKYAVTATRILASVDMPRIRREGLLRDVSNPQSGYEDGIAVMSPSRLWDYAVTDDTRKWLEELPSEVLVVLVHEYEWESYLSD